MSDKDIRDVTTNANLSVSDLDQVFLELGMSNREIENTKYNAREYTVDIQANRVLEEWRQRHGKEATRQAIITALEAGNRTEAVETLQDKWGMTPKGISNNYIHI